jgi:hypothetical protein
MDGAASGMNMRTIALPLMLAFMITANAFADNPFFVRIAEKGKPAVQSRSMPTHHPQ